MPLTLMPTQNWRALQDARRQKRGRSYLADFREYARLIHLGAWPEEALDALLFLESDWEKAATLGRCLPRACNAGRLEDFMIRHRIHPLSVATQLQNRHQAIRFLQQTGWEACTSWIGPRGNLVLQHSPVWSLPKGLVLRGNAVIRDCPQLEDLGEGLRVMAGDLVIERCPKLRQLPDGLETLDLTGISINGDGAETPFAARQGNLALLGCPRLEAFGVRTRIRGLVLALGCPGLSEEACAAVQDLEEIPSI